MESTRAKFDQCPSIKRFPDQLYTPRAERHKHTTRQICKLGSAGHQDSSKDPPSWCETPKLAIKSASLRRRLLVSLSSSDGSKTGNTNTPKDNSLCQTTSEDFSSNQNTPGDLSLNQFTPGDSSQNENCLSFDSPFVSPSGPHRFSTLKSNEFICQKRRLLFSQALTSTIESEVQASPVVILNPEPDLDETIIISGPPSSPQSCTSPLREEKRWNVEILEGTVHTPALEDSGFNSLGLDKSHNSTVDHDGSFQELVTPHDSSGQEKRRSRLERQRRLSTLKEGGSQSEDHPRAPERVLSNKDEVFLEHTPLSAALTKMQDLSLTPALQVVHALSRRCTQSLQQQNSLEELLRNSQVDQTGSFDLSRLIGRKMGLTKVDVISELRMRSMQHILTFILSFLTAADLFRFGQVSEEWNQVIFEDRKAAHRRKNHIRELKLALEGGRPAHVPEADTRAVLEFRAALGSVQAQAKTPHMNSSLSCTPKQSGSKHAQFVEVAQTLFNDEYLKPCPRCQRPARCHNLRAEGVCSWSDCSFHFCMSCLCEAHGSRDCAHTPLSNHTLSHSYSERSGGKKELLPGSARSKRNVRRL